MTEQKKSKSLAVIENFEVPALLESQDFIEEMDGLQFRFTHVKVPSGGGLAFELPGDEDDEPEIEKTLEGVIVHHHAINAYWSDEYTGGNEPPDCSSLDGKFGIGEPGGECSVCPKNQWGTGRDEKGKACNNRRRVYILREGEMFPILLSLPPTSLGNFSDLLSRRILQRGMTSKQVIVKAKLKKAVSGSNIEYSQVTWGVLNKLDDATAAKMKEYGESIKALAGGLTVDQVEGAEIADIEPAPAAPDDDPAGSDDPF